MRISGWSSDVCSSDLAAPRQSRARSSRAPSTRRGWRSSRSETAGPSCENLHLGDGDEEKEDSERAEHTRHHVRAAALAAAIFGFIVGLRVGLFGHSGHEWLAMTAPQRMKI